MMGQRIEAFLGALTEAFAELGMAAPTATEGQLLAAHYKLLIKWNERLNLTRIVEPAAAARLHYAESLYAARFLPAADRWLDVGAGPGFPSIPLAITNRSLRITALESNQRKSVFLKEAKDLLGLQNLDVVCARLEAIDWREFPGIVSRAIDKAERIYPQIARGLGQGQAFVILCSRPMVETMGSSLPDGVWVDAHEVPGSKARVIAVLRRTN